MALIEIRDVLDNETGKTIFPRTHVDAVIGLEDSSFFEKVQDTQDPTKYSIKLKSDYTGLWAEGWIAAGGVNGSGSGGGGGLIQSVLGISDLGNPIATESLTETFSAKAIESIFERVVALENATPQIDLSDYGAGLSLTKTTSASYLRDANGGYLLDANGNRIIVGGQYSEVSHLNLLNKEGDVLSSVDLDIDLTSYATRSWVQQNFLTQETDPTVPAWAKADTKPSYSLSEISGADDLLAIEAITGESGLLKKTGNNTWALDTTSYVPSSRNINGVDLSEDRNFYVGKTLIQSASQSQGLTGITSVKATEVAASMFAWDEDLGAWHFYGNVYADGWMAAGGIGSSSSGGSNVSISNLLSSGTRVATITIDGIGYDILAPSAGGITAESDPVFNASAAAGITQADIARWNNAGGSSVSVDQLQTTGTAIAAITVDGVRTTLYAPTSGGIASETDPIFSASAAAGITAANITAWNNKSDFSGSYNDLTNKPTIPTAVSQLTNDSGYVTSQALNTALAGYATNLALAGKQDKYPFTISGTANETYNLADFVTLDTAQTITGAKTFSGGITMSGANILPSADSANSLGSNDYRFNAAFIRNIYTSFFQFRDGTTKAVTGNIAFGDGYLQLSLAGTDAVNYMFYSGSGFFKQGGGVPLGRSDHRWSSVYSVDADLSGDLALASSSHIDIGPLRIEYDATNKALHITKKDSTDTETYGLYADSFIAAGGVQQTS